MFSRGALLLAIVGVTVTVIVGGFLFLGALVNTAGSLDGLPEEHGVQ